MSATAKAAPTSDKRTAASLENATVKFWGKRTDHLPGESSMTDAVRVDGFRTSEELLAVWLPQGYHVQIVGVKSTTPNRRVLISCA
jgi:hypothetical protein